MARLSVEEILEDIDLSNNPLPEVQLEVEENVEIEKEQAANEVEFVLQDNEQAQDSIEVMNDAVNTVQEKLAAEGMVTTTEMKLLQMVSQASLVGTEFQTSQVYPSMESSDPAIALEGIGERLKAILQGVVNGFKSIIRSIVNFIGKVILAFRSYRGRIAKILAKFQKLQKDGKTTAPELTLKHREIYRVENTHVSSLEEVLKHVSNTTTILENVFDNASKYAVVVEKEYGVFGAITDMLKSNEMGIKFFDDAATYTKQLISTAKLSKSKTVNARDHYVSQSFVGGHFIEVTVPAAGSYQKDNVRDLKLASLKFGVGFNYEQIPGTEPAKKITFNNVKIGSYVKALTDVDSAIVKVIKAFSKIESIYNSVSAELDQLFNSHPILQVAGKAFEAVSFSYRMMRLNNRMVFGTLYAFDSLADYYVSQFIWSANEASNSKSWE